MKCRRERKRSNYYWRMLLAYLILLLFPVGFMETVNFFYTRETTLESLNSFFKNEGHKQLGVLEEQFVVLQKVAGQAKMTRYFYEPFAGQHYPIAVLDIRTNFAEQSAWLSFFSSIYYYNEDEGKGIFSNGMMTREWLEENFVFEKQDVLEQFEAGDYRVTELMNHAAGKEQIAFITPLEIKNGRNVSFLIFIIDRDRLKNMLSIPQQYQGGNVDLYFNDELIYSSDRRREALEEKETMLLSVEEGVFRLVWRIPHSAYTEALFSNIWKQFIMVFAALAVGLFLIYKFMEHNYKPLRILVKNLSEKMELGEDSAAESKDEVEYIDMMMGNLLYSKQFLEESNQAIKREQLLYQLLCSHIQQGSVIYQECVLNHIRVDRTHFICLYLEEQQEEARGYRYLTETLEQENGDISVYSTYYTDFSFIFLIAADMKEEQLLSLLRKGLKDSRDAHVIFGSVVDSVDQIPDSYRSLETEGRRNKKNPGKEENWTEFTYPITSLTALKEAAESEQLEKMGLALQNIRNALEEAPPAVRVLLYTETAAVLTEKRKDVGQMLDMVGDDNMAGRRLGDDLQRLYKQFRAESILTSVESVGDDRKIVKRWNRDIGSIVDYIEKHCGESSFSIKLMAVEMGTTPSNLSHYFKKNTGQNISKYIDAVRMERAKEMLRSGKTIVSVSESLGYNSVSVFIETFKRVSGTTPGQYRQEQDKN